MLSDLRYALRTLRHNAGFAATAILSIGLGIGANSAIFSIADGLLLRPLPIADSSSLVALRDRSPSGRFIPMSYREYQDYAEQSRSFESLVAYSLEQAGLATEPRAQAQSKMGVLVSPGFFSAMGVQPALGRDFTREETAKPGGSPVVILSHDLWALQFGGDPNVIGRTIRVNGVDLNVVGVAPESFYGLDLVLRPAFYAPFVTAPRLFPTGQAMLNDRDYRGSVVRGRLKPGVTMAAANAEASRIATSLASAFPVTNEGYGAAVRTEMQYRIDEDPYDSMAVAFLFAIVLIVFTIACANVANLMLTRGRARAREIAVRLSMGATRARLVRQFLLESTLIAAAGGFVGLLMTKWAVYGFSQLEVVGDVPVKLAIQMDDRVLAFTALVAMVSALLFGLVPALRSTRTDLTPALKSGDLRPERTGVLGRNLLVTAQVAGSVALMIAATQVARGFGYVLSSYPGYERHNRLSMRFDPSIAGYSPEKSQQFYRDLMNRVREVPGVRSAALASFLPLENNQGSMLVSPEGFQFPGNQKGVAIRRAVVDENYFATMRVPLLQGRAFLESDGANAPRAIVVNEAFANRYLGSTPIGKRVRVGGDDQPWSQVIGVVATGKYQVVVEPPTPFFYLPYRQNPWQRLTLIAEAQGDALALAAPIKLAAAAVDPQVPVLRMRTLEDIWDQRSVKIFSLLSNTVSSMGAIGLLLALVGLYAVVSYQVSRRTREIGVRMAVGADAGSVLGLFLRQSALMGSAGVLIGMALSYAGSLALTSSPLAAPSMNLGLFFGVPAALLFTTMAAAAIPARRASRIDPLKALRQE